MSLRASAVFLVFDGAFWMAFKFAERALREGYDLFVKARYNIMILFDQQRRRTW